MANFFCKHCGHKSSGISSLTSSSCVRHPNGANKGKHMLYEGGEKAHYHCRFCGHKAGSITGLTADTCIRHPNGANKGKHEPAL